jgi:hypothetical protein
MVYIEYRVCQSKGNLGKIWGQWAFMEKDAIHCFYLTSELDQIERDGAL